MLDIGLVRRSQNLLCACQGYGPFTTGPPSRRRLIVSNNKREDGSSRMLGKDFHITIVDALDRIPPPCYILHVARIAPFSSRMRGVHVRCTIITASSTRWRLAMEQQLCVQMDGSKVEDASLRLLETLPPPFSTPCLAAWFNASSQRYQSVRVNHTAARRPLHCYCNHICNHVWVECLRRHTAGGHWGRLPGWHFRKSGHAVLRQRRGLSGGGVDIRKSEERGTWTAKQENAACSLKSSKNVASQKKPEVHLFLATGRSRRCASKLLSPLVLDMPLRSWSERGG